MNGPANRVISAEADNTLRKWKSSGTPFEITFAGHVFRVIVDKDHGAEHTGLSIAIRRANQALLKSKHAPKVPT